MSAAGIPAAAGWSPCTPAIGVTDRIFQAVVGCAATAPANTRLAHRVAVDDIVGGRRRDQPGGVCEQPCSRALRLATASTAHNPLAVRTSVRFGVGVAAIDDLKTRVENTRRSATMLPGHATVSVSREELVDLLALVLALTDQVRGQIR